jgi:PAS domain S-box-containing protein
VFDTASVGVLELDREGRVVDANPMFRRSVPGIVGRQATSAMTHADALRHAPLWQELMDGRRSRYEIAATLRTPDGTAVPGSVVVTAVVDGAGEVIGAVAIAAHDSLSAESPSLQREQPTAAEIAVLTGLASGLTLQQVAVRLGLTRRGVDYRLARLRQKLRTDGPGGIPATTAGVVARGYAIGLLTPGTWPPRPGPGA